MHRFARTLIALSILMAGLALVPFVSLPTQAFGWQLYANAYQPVLSLNHTTGAPGSFFRVTGSGFQADTTATVLVSGVMIGTTATDSSGEVDFLVSTAQADLGYYWVTVIAGGSATATFRLVASEPQRPPQGGGPVLDVPSGLAAANVIYLPMILR